MIKGDTRAALDICFLNIVPETEVDPIDIEEDQTVSAENPLGVTQVTYQPDTEKMQALYS